MSFYSKVRQMQIFAGLILMMGCSSLLISLFYTTTNFNKNISVFLTGPRVYRTVETGDMDHEPAGLVRRASRVSDVVSRRVAPKFQPTHEQIHQKTIHPNVKKELKQKTAVKSKPKPRAQPKPKKAKPKVKTTVKPRVFPCDPFEREFVRGKVRYLCNHMKSRLGNQMFSYAAAYGIAKMKNMTVVVDRKRILNRLFKLDAVLVDDMCFCENATRMNETLNCGYSENVVHFIPNKNYDVSGYLQSWRYFYNVIPEIKKQYTFNETIRQKAENILQYIVEKYKISRGKSRRSTGKKPTLVGVHIRRGDMISLKKYQKFGYTTAPISYVLKAFKYFTSKYPDVVFVVCSDTISYVKENFHQDNLYVVEGNSAEEDMAVLSSCDHTIQTVGTFGWWSAFLGKGTSVYYKHPAREGSPLREKFSKDYSDFFCPDWIGME